MRYALLVVVSAPAIAGAVALVWRHPAGAMGPSLTPRAFGAGGVAAAIAGAAWVMWRTGSEVFIPPDGFDGDAWRGLLVMGVAAGAGAWLVRRREAVDVLAARLALTSALAGTIVAADGVTAAAFLAASAGCMCWLGVRGHVSRRSAGAIIVTDLALIAAIALRVGGGLAAPMPIDGWVAWIWGAALVVRVVRWGAHGEEPGLALAYRLQAFWFVVWMVEADALTQLGVVAAVGAALAARRSARDGSGVALGVAFAMLTLVSASLRNAELAPATALLAVATTVTGVLCALGRPRGALSGLVPAGVALPGVALLTTVVLRADGLMGRATAVAVCVAVAYASVAVGTALLDARTRARPAWAVLPLGFGALIAAWPRVITDAVAPALSASVPGGSLVPFDTGLPRGLVAAAVAVVVAVTLAERPGAVPDGEAVPDRERAVVDGPMDVAAGWDVVRAHAALAATAGVVALVVLVRGIARGFL